MTPMLTALVIGAAASIGWMNQRQYQLGGGWIGNNGAGNIWNALQIPLDPAGRTAALRIHLPIYNTEFAGLLTALGADSISDAVGEVKMVGRGTAKYQTVFYLHAQGNPPTLRAIAANAGTVKFTAPDNIEVAYMIDVYPVNVPGLPNADADADGFPNPGSVPIVSLPGLDTAKRVPALFLDQVRTRVRGEYAAQERADRFDLMERFLPGESGALSYAQAAAQLGIPEGTLKSDVHRLKRRYGQVLREEIAHIVAGPEEIDDELRHLIAVVGRYAHGQGVLHRDLKPSNVVIDPTDQPRLVEQQLAERQLAAFARRRAATDNQREQSR